MLQLGGVLPVSALNVGLQASIGGLQVEQARLEADLTKLQFAAQGQLEVKADFPPNPLNFETNLSLGLTATELAASLTPGNISAAGVDANVDAAAELGLVEGQIGIVENVVLSLGLGLDAGEINGWSYSGRAAAYGTELERATARGFGRFSSGDQVQGLVIATESFASWGSFSQGFYTAGTAATEATARDARLRYLGVLSGGQWNTGVADVFGRIRLLLLELRGIKAALDANIRLTLGLDLPDEQAQLDAGLEIVGKFGIDGLIDNLVNVQADFDASIAGLQAKLTLVASLIADLTLQLSAGGLAFWSYTGTAAGFGAGLRQAIAAGVPEGSGPNAVAYGIALAGAAPTMSAFGNIFLTA